MSTPEAQEYAVSLLLLIPPSDPRGKNQILPKAGRALGRLQGEQFVPTTKLSADVISGRSSLPMRYVALSHSPVRNEDTSVERRVTLGLTRSDDRELWLLSVNFFATLAVGDAEAAWQIGLKAGPCLVQDLSPVAAFINGNVVEEDADVFPELGGLASGNWPEAITPWTYLGPSFVPADKRRILAALPAAKSAALGDGWVIQAVAHLTDPPPRQVLEHLRSMRPKGVGYMRPVPPLATESP